MERTSKDVETTSAGKGKKFDPIPAQNPASPCPSNANPAAAQPMDSSLLNEVKRHIEDILDATKHLRETRKQVSKGQYRRIEFLNTLRDTFEKAVNVFNMLSFGVPKEGLHDIDEQRKLDGQHLLAKQHTWFIDQLAAERLFRNSPDFAQVQKIIASARECKDKFQFRHPDELRNPNRGDLNCDKFEPDANFLLVKEMLHHVVAYFNKWLRLKGVCNAAIKCICDECIPLQGLKDLTQKIGADGQTLRENMDPESLTRWKEKFADDIAKGDRLLKSWNTVAGKLRENDSDGDANWHKFNAKKEVAKPRKQRNNETNMRIFEVPKKHIGLIIGKSGQKKSEIKRESKARIEVEDKRDPVEVRIYGTPDSIQKAVDLIKKIRSRSGQKVEMVERN